MRAIITISDISKLARPTYGDNDQDRACLHEAEMLDMQRVLGPSLYADLKDECLEPDDTLMEGGTYTDGCGRKHVIAGVKRALAYYAYARIIRTGSQVQTRGGWVEKEGDYSELADARQREKSAQEMTDIADRYMNECLAYVYESDKWPDYENEAKNKVNNSRYNLRVIGRRTL